MVIGNKINKIRTKAKLTQEQFAEIFAVSQQSVQKWENGLSTPDLDKIIAISKYFDISLDSLILDSSPRAVEEMGKTKEIKPLYENVHKWEFYATNLLIEYQQCMEEGLDVEVYKDVFAAASCLPQGEIKKKLGDVLFETVVNAKQRENYPYIEPSELEQIRSLRKGSVDLDPVDEDALEDKIHGAWIGRLSGCLLGMALEGVYTDELIPFLQETGNYPMHRYILRSDMPKASLDKYKFPFQNRAHADLLNFMPADDDTNYVILAQEIVQTYGRDFTPRQVSQAWVGYQSKNAYCTAERVAFCNFVKGFVPPQSAVYKNPFREWIGAQIRGDYFGYINPGNPELAAGMAWRDASISHVKNGIYGEMLISAMIAVAATTDDMEKIIRGGLAQIPGTSRMYEAILSVLNAYGERMSQHDCFGMIHEKFDETDAHDWCHAISNAMIVVASLLYGQGDFGRSICMAVETGFDTDCNGATVGSIVGMINGFKKIPAEWNQPINDTLRTSIFGVGTVKVTDRVKMTLEHIKNK